MGVVWWYSRGGDRKRYDNVYKMTICRVKSKQWMIIEVLSLFSPYYYLLFYLGYFETEFYYSQAGVEIVSSSESPEPWEYRPKL